MRRENPFMSHSQTRAQALNYPRGFYTAVTPPASATIIHRATNFLDVAVAVGASGVLTVVVRSK